MGNYIAAAVVLLIVGLAALYVIRSKKSGKRCIGCPEGSCGSTCGGVCSSSCGNACCGCGETTEK